MPGPRSHGGWRRHVRIARNTADADYGATPGAIDWNWLPIIGDGMKLKATAPRFVPDTNYSADFRRQVAIYNRHEVAGDLTTLLWPEVTPYLFDMGLLRVDDAASPNHQDLYGHVIEHHTPDDPRRVYGAVVNTMRLACTGTGDNDVQLTLSMLGQREEEIVYADPDYSALTPSPFMFAHARIELDGALVTDVDAWTLTVENNIGDAPFIWNAAVGAAVRVHAIANLRVVTLELTELNNDDRFNQAIRTGAPVTFEALFTHPDGHLLQIILPACYVEESPEDGTPSQQATENPTLHVQRAASGLYVGEDIIYGVDLAAGGTTTLEGLTTTAALTTTTEAPTTTTEAPTTTTGA